MFDPLWKIRNFWLLIFSSQPKTVSSALWRTILKFLLTDLSLFFLITGNNEQVEKASQWSSTRSQRKVEIYILTIILLTFQGLCQVSQALSSFKDGTLYCLTLKSDQLLSINWYILTLLVCVTEQCYVSISSLVFGLCANLYFLMQRIPKISGFSTAYAYKYKTKRQEKIKRRQKNDIFVD